MQRRCNRCVTEVQRCNPSCGWEALVCLGRLFEPLICCRVTKDLRMRPSTSSSPLAVEQ